MYKLSSSTRSRRTVPVRVIAVHNLCRDDKFPNAYIPTGTPRVIAPEGLEPLAQDSSGIVVGMPGAIGILDPDKGSTDIIDRIQGQPRCVTQASNDRLAAMMPDGPRIYDRNDDGSRGASGDLPQWSPITITAAEWGQLTLSTDAIELSTEYGPGPVYNSEDASGIQTTLRKAYSRLAADARQNGVFIQPVIARAIVEDKYGAIMYRGPEVLVLPPGGPALDMPVELPMTVRNAVDRADISVNAFRLRVDTPAMPDNVWADRAATLRIEVSPQIHPYSSDNTCNGTVTVVRKGTSALAVLADMPGCANAISRNAPERSCALIGSMIAHFDRIRTTATVFSRPFERGLSRTVIPHSIMALADETKAIHGLLDAIGKSSAPAQRQLALCNAPHRFTARLCAAGPAHIAWADITALRFGGYSAADFAASTGAGRWTARTSVTFADGSTSQRITSGDGNMPLTLGPVLSYPDPTATGIDIVVESDAEGSVPQRWRASLQPDSTGLRAISIDSACSVRQPTPDTDAWIKDLTGIEPSPVHMQSAIAVASSQTPFNLAAITDMGQKIIAIVPAASTSATWDFGRTRYYAFTTDKVGLINYSAGTNTFSTGTMVVATVNDCRAITTDGSGRTFFVCGDSIHSIDGSKVTPLTRIPTDIDRLGYDRSRNMLIGTHSSGSADMYHIDTTGSIPFTTSSIGPSNDWLSAGSRLLAASQDGLLDIAMASRLNPDAPIQVRLTAATHPASVLQTISNVVWNIESDAFTGRLTLMRNYMSDRSCDISYIAIDGRITAPVLHRVLTRPMASAVLDVAGSASANTRINPPTVLS